MLAHYFKPLPHGRCNHVYVRCCACRRREYERDPGMLLRQLHPDRTLEIRGLLKKFIIRLQATESRFQYGMRCSKLFTSIDHGLAI
jgi:hypothetical protein